jgi:hypothetical protein
VLLHTKTETGSYRNVVWYCVTWVSKIRMIQIIDVFVHLRYLSEAVRTSPLLVRGSSYMSATCPRQFVHVRYLSEAVRTCPLLVRGSSYMSVTCPRQFVHVRYLSEAVLVSINAFNANLRLHSHLRLATNFVRSFHRSIVCYMSCASSWSWLCHSNIVWWRTQFKLPTSTVHPSPNVLQAKGKVLPTTGHEGPEGE